MLCSKCGREIPKGQEVQRGTHRGGQGTLLDDPGGVMCKECAFPPFWKKGWFWLIVLFVVVVVIGGIASVFKGKP